ncbi:MAG: hypothetical protein K2P81_07785 [Bacteriovoracaceae bacterium]|nr:hypothetical protein [Bacteriovoracaceae bacterium]
MKFFVLMFTLFQALNSQAEGLKKVNYASETADLSNSSNGKAEESLTPEQKEKILKEVEELKKKQLESQKVLNDIEESEE